MPASDPSPPDPTHAGAVAVRLDQDAPRFLVVSSLDGSSWVLPKGHVDVGERVDEAASRELAEETGVRGKILAPLSTRRFRKDGGDVIVCYYLIVASHFGASSEGRKLRWETEAQALDALSFPGARAAVREGAARLREASS